MPVVLHELIGCAPACSFTKKTTPQRSYMRLNKLMANLISGYAYARMYEFNENETANGSKSSCVCVCV